MAPLAVVMVASYSLVVSMDTPGCVGYWCTLAGAWSGGSADPNVAVEQSANGMTLAEADADALAVGVDEALGDVPGATALLARLTPTATAMSAAASTTPEPITSGSRRGGTPPG